VLVEKKFQLGDDRNCDLALRTLRFVYMAPPNGFFNSNFRAVVVLPGESSDFSLARSGEGRRGDYRCDRLRKNGLHLGLFFERVRVGFSSWPRFGNFNIMHWAYVFQHALATRITERAAQKVFDVA
jgi:hypothetical protein